MRTLLFIFLLLCLCTCQKENLSSINDPFIGMYEGIRTEVYEYSTDYLGKDTIVLDTQRQSFIWEVAKAKSDTLLVDSKKFTPVEANYFTHLNIANDPYGSFLVENSKVWFLPEQDSFYMET
ncbi:MAG: hypothetical protein AAFO82_21700, partial [Bacteroidota bacterium]